MTVCEDRLEEAKTALFVQKQFQKGQQDTSKTFKHLLVKMLLLGGESSVLEIVIKKCSFKNKTKRNAVSNGSLLSPQTDFLS